MRENRLSGSEGGARFYPSFLPLSFLRLHPGDTRMHRMRFPGVKTSGATITRGVCARVGDHNRSRHCRSRRAQWITATIVTMSSATR